MRSLLYSFLAIAFAVSDASATAQFGDVLEFEGQREELYTTPLEDYFNEDRKRPEFPMGSTACWRGYIALWSLKDNQLSLVSLHEEDHHSPNILGKKIPLKPIFGLNAAPVKADWFTGVLRLPRGKQLRYVHMGFGSIHEKDIYLTIKKGKLVVRREVSNTDEGATRSTSDLEWVSLAETPLPGDGEWTDARLISEKPEDFDLTTRGIFIPGMDGTPPSLWIPETATTETVEIPLVLQTKSLASSGAHTEVSGRYDRKRKEIRVHTMRELKPGETIHHAKFQQSKAAPSPTPAQTK